MPTENTFTFTITGFRVASGLIKASVISKFRQIRAMLTLKRMLNVSIADVLTVIRETCSSHVDHVLLRCQIHLAVFLLELYLVIWLDVNSSAFESSEKHILS